MARDRQTVAEVPDRPSVDLGSRPERSVMDIKELVQKSVDEWNAKDKKAFVANFTESSEITGPGGWSCTVWRGSPRSGTSGKAPYQTIRARSALSSYLVITHVPK